MSTEGMTLESHRLSKTKVHNEYRRHDVRNSSHYQNTGTQ